ncbi:MAG: hypothetical protein ACREJG_12895, partial [Candidatus Rokuibacteriota bacterium]
MRLRLRIIRVLLGRRRPRRTYFAGGVVASVLIHVALFGVLFYVKAPDPIRQKRGDALIVELSSIDSPAPRGNPVPAPRT